MTKRQDIRASWRAVNWSGLMQRAEEFNAQLTAIRLIAAMGQPQSHDPSCNQQVRFDGIKVPTDYPQLAPSDPLYQATLTGDRPLIR